MNSVNLNGAPDTDATRVTERAETSRVTEATTAPPAANASTPPPADTITVSEQAAQVRRLAAKIKDLPEVRQARIEHLRAQVQSGSYHRTAQEIAEAIIQESAKPEVDRKSVV